jgi:stage III sporulation protein AD
VDILFKVAGIAVAGMVLTVLVKKHSPEIGLLLGLMVTVTVIILGLDVFRPLKDFIDIVITETGIAGELAAPLWKAGVIAIITKITAELCRDAGEKAAAAGVETAGSVLGLFVVLPLFSAFFDLIRKML